MDDKDGKLMADLLDNEEEKPYKVAEDSTRDTNPNNNE